MTQTSTSAVPQEQINLTIEGYAGIGAIYNGGVVALAKTEGGGDIILDQTITDSTGHFTLEISNANASNIILRISGGSYIDPISNKTVSLGEHELSAIISPNKDGESVMVTLSPMTTLFEAFTESVEQNTSLNADPFRYAREVFRTIFLVDPANAQNRTLADTAEDTEQNNLITLYDLAFAKMARDFNAASTIDLVNAFAQSLNETCSLSPYTPIKSGAYTVNANSFVQDYLESFSEIVSVSTAGPYTSNLDIAEIVEHILDSNHFLLGYDYEP